LNESHGRKKNEEIIAKVINWSTGEQHPSLRSPQHTPLKSLLGKASMETKSKPLNAKEIPVEKDGPSAKDNGALPKKIQKNPINLMIRFPGFKAKKLNLTESEFGSVRFEFLKI
jgi:hypothetical protein